MQEKEMTLAIVKPDAVKRKLIGKIITLIEKESFNIIAMKLVFMSKKKAEAFYSVHNQKPFFQSLTSFMSSGPCLVMVLEGFRVIDNYRNFIGATDPAKAKYGTIRRLFGTSVERNVVHGSDSPENAQKEINFFFSENEFITSI